MTKPMNVKKFAHILAADRELEDIERRLKLSGDRSAARRIGEVRETLAKALGEEQVSVYEALIDLM